MTKTKVAKVLVPVVMVVVIVGIWLSQNNEQSIETAQTDDHEFPLNVSSVDLETLSQHELPIIIDFGADECIPCKEMAPVLVSLNEEMQGKAIVQFVDVWKNPTGATGFPVQVIPTQVIVNADGTPYYPSDAVAADISFTLYSDSNTDEHVFTVHQGGLTEDQMRLILADMGVQ